MTCLNQDNRYGFSQAAQHCQHSAAVSEVSQDNMIPISTLAGLGRCIRALNPVLSHFLNIQWHFKHAVLIRHFW